MSLESISVIGFDLDNTLYPVTDEMQERIRKRIYEKLASCFGIPIKQAGRLFEDNYNGNYKWSYSGSRTIIELARQQGIEWNKENGAEIVQQSIENADILEFIQSNPQLCEMFRKLAQKYKLDLITGTSYDSAYAKLKRIGIEKEIFRNIFAEKSKTERIYIDWIKQEEMLSEQMLYIGDNKKQDIDTPNSLGIITCYVGGDYDGADFCIQNILELESLLNSYVKST